MSPSYAEAVMREAKTDIAAQKSAFEGILLQNSSLLGF